jgi:WD40 repeat protein
VSDPVARADITGNSNVTVQVVGNGTRVTVNSGAAAPSKPPMTAPAPPADFVERPTEFGALKAKLLCSTGESLAITAALRGAGGYGKTTLAKALANDQDIKDYYCDGILWVELGEQPPSVVSILSDQIEILTAERPGLASVNAAAAKLGEALSDRRMLLIIDDAWRQQDLLPFLRGGCNTSRLVTTRRDDILPPGTQRQHVDAMQVGEAFKLLSLRLPKDQVEVQTRALEALTVRLGEWAQLLKLVNGFLRDRILKHGQTLEETIRGVNERLDEKGLTAFDARREADRSNAIAITIGVSLGLLAEVERCRFTELAVFPEHADIPIGITERFWLETGGLSKAATEDLLVWLENLSLLLSLDLKRAFRLHDTVRAFLQNQLGKETLTGLHKTLLQALEPCPDEAAARRYYYVYRPAHLESAGERAALDELLLDPGWLQAKLASTRNLYLLFSDYQQFSQTPFQTFIGRTFRLISGICARDPAQLLPQLYGRIMGFGYPETTQFLEQARKHLSSAALLTQYPSLIAPGAEVARLEGHRGQVLALSLLPDGRLASAAEDNTVRIWDIKSGAELKQLLGHTGTVLGLAVLPNGDLASCSYDNTIRIWDLQTGKQVHCLTGHRSEVMAIAVLPNGRLASASNDKTIRIWDLRSFCEVGCIRGQFGGGMALVALPNDQLASVSSNEKTIQLWDLRRCAEAGNFAGHSKGIKALIMLSDGRLVSGSEDCTIRVWDLEVGMEVMRLGTENENYVGITGLAELPNGLLASSDPIAIWELENQKKVLQLRDHDGLVQPLVALPDGRLVSGSADSTIRLWDISEAITSSRYTDTAHTGWVYALGTMQGGEPVSGGNDLRIWNRTTGEVIRKISHGYGVSALAVLSDGRIATGSWSDTSIRLWDITRGVELEELSVQRADYREITALTELPGGRLAAGSSDNDIYIFDLVTGTAIASLSPGERMYTGGIEALATLSDGRLIVASESATISAWWPESGSKLFEVNIPLPRALRTEWTELVGNFYKVESLIVLPDGQLVSGVGDGTIRIWDTISWTERSFIQAHSGGVTSLAVLTCGWLASGSTDRTIRVWDLAQGAEIARIEIDAQVVSLAALSNNRLVAGDGIGRLHWLEIVMPNGC